METFLDLSLSSSLNVLTADMSSQRRSVLVSNYLAFGVLGTFVVLMIALPIIYWKKFS